MQLINGETQSIKAFLQDKLGKLKSSTVNNGAEKFKTDLGYLTSENLEYLLTDQKLLAYNGDDYSIRNLLIDDSKFSRPVQYFSLFLHIKEDIENNTGVKDINAIVDVMRKGINNGSQMYGRVEDLIQKGKYLVFKVLERRGGKNKKRGGDFAV